MDFVQLYFFTLWNWQKMRPMTISKVHHSLGCRGMVFLAKVCFEMFDILLIAYGQSIYKHVRESYFTWLSNGQVCRGMLRCIWLIREMAVFLLSFIFLLCKNNSRGIKTALNKFERNEWRHLFWNALLKKFCLKSNLNFKHQSNRYNFENDEI